MSIELNMTSEFQYEKMARQVDEIQDPEKLKQLLKDYIKLHLKEKEVWKQLTMQGNL